MALPDSASGTSGAHCFLPTPPFAETKRLARKYGCDIAVPNGPGIGNVLMFTRAVEELARASGRRLKVLTAPLNPSVGLISGEEPYPLWKENPFVSNIINSSDVDQSIISIINNEQDNIVQFGHMIENICFHYGIKPRNIRPSIFLSNQEMRWAIDQLADLPRPVICLHPYGTSSPLPDHPWNTREWLQLCGHLSEKGSLLELGKAGSDNKKLPTFRKNTNLREMMALVWASDMFIGFDSSIAHVATGFQIPAVVLWEPHQKLFIEERWQVGFAPAALSRWGYPQNRNIFLLGDRDDTIVELIRSWVDEKLRSVGAKCQG